MKHTFYFDGIKPRMMQYISSKEASDMKEHTAVSGFIYKNIAGLICTLPLVLLFMIIYVIVLWVSMFSEWLVARLDELAELFPVIKCTKVIEVDGTPITTKETL